MTAVMPRGERVVPTGEHRDGFVEVRWQDATGWAFGQASRRPPPSDGETGSGCYVLAAARADRHHL